MNKVARYVSSIRAKFLLLVVLLLSAIFVILVVYLIRTDTKTLRNQLLDEARAFATLATEPIGATYTIFKDSGTARIDGKIDEFLLLSENITDIAVVDVAGSVVYGDADTGFSYKEADAASFVPVFVTNENGELVTVVYPYFESSGAHRFSVLYNVSNQQINKSIQEAATSILIFAVLTLAATTTLLYILINRFIIRPVREVSEQADMISAGNLEQQIEVRGKDEIAHLGIALNKMTDSLKGSIAELKEVDRVKSEFMMITSHNLRTPLTIITGYLDSMKHFKNDPEKLDDALSRISASAHRLAVFSEDVLTISRFELGEETLEQTSVKLDDFVKKIVDDFSPLAMQRKHEFKVNVNNGDEKINISQPHVRSAIWNLLDNAEKFTPEGGSISLDAQIDEGRIIFKISDNGVGIAEDEIPKLFTKFHRGTSTEVYDFEGTGIGLYASKVIIERHGGTITAESTKGKGSTFTITLHKQPKNDEDAII